MADRPSIWSLRGRRSRRYFVEMHGLLVLAIGGAGSFHAVLQAHQRDSGWEGFWLGCLTGVVASLVPSFTLTTQRFRDISLTGWCAVVTHASLLSGVVLLRWELLWGGLLLLPVALLAPVLCIWPSTRGDNRYGPDPLA